MQNNKQTTVPSPDDGETSVIESDRSPKAANEPAQTKRKILRHPSDPHGRHSAVARISRELAHLLWVGEYFMVAAAVFGFVLFNWGWRGPSAEFVYVFSGFATSALMAFIVISTQHWHGRHSMDHDLTGIQKSHDTPVPRIGGVAVFMAVVVTSVVLKGLANRTAQPDLFDWGHTLLLLAVCGLPAFGLGLLEDVTKRISVQARLVATFASAALAAWLLDAVLPRLSVPGLDMLLAYPMVGLAITIFAVGGMANAVNIIDGFNGLASGVTVFLGLAFAGLAAGQNDNVLLALSLTLSAAAGGFMLLNYPHGRIFLGDGGAYFIGFYLAELSVLMCARHPEISAWTLLTVLSYPVVEVVVSIIRRKLSNASPGQPDRGHFHQHLQRFLQHYYGGRSGGVVYIVNPQVSPVVWFMNVLNIALAFACQGSDLRAFVGFAVSAVLYLVMYFLLGVINEREQARPRHTH